MISHIQSFSIGVLLFSGVILAGDAFARYFFGKEVSMKKYFLVQSVFILILLIAFNHGNLSII
jgi:hypothetical protein